MSSLPPTFVPGFHDEDAVRNMQYNVLGDTGLMVSKIGLGGTCFCDNFYRYFDEKEAIATIHSAIKKGINYIDTAPYYGQGKSEEILGKALKDIPRQAYYIATKVGRYGTTPETGFDYTAARTLASVNDSLQKLGLDSVDIIQVHDIEFPENLDTVINECLPTLEKEVVAKGKARFIGVTGYPVSVLKQAIERSTTKISTIISYARSTLIDDTLSEYLPFMKLKGIAVVNAAVTAMCLLTNDGPLAWHPAHPDTIEICKQAADYCKEKGVELGRLALYNSVSNPDLVIHLIGMNKRDVLDMNLKIVADGISQTEKQLLEELKDRYFSKVKHHHWEGEEVSRYRAALGLKYP